MMNSAPLGIRTSSLSQWERLKGKHSESWAYGVTKIASVSRSAEQLKYASLWLSVVAPSHIVCLFDSSLSSSVVVPNCQVRWRKCLCPDSFVLKHCLLSIKWKLFSLQILNGGIWIPPVIWVGRGTNVCCDALVVCLTETLAHIDFKPLNVGGSGNYYRYLFSFSVSFSPLTRHT